MQLVGTFYTKRGIMYNGYQTLVMHNPFSTYSQTHIIHNGRLFIMNVTDVLLVILQQRGKGSAGTIYSNTTTPDIPPTKKFSSWVGKSGGVVGGRYMQVLSKLTYPQPGKIGKNAFGAPHKRGQLNWKNKLYLLCNILYLLCNIFVVLHSILCHRYILLFCFCIPVIL